MKDADDRYREFLTPSTEVDRRIALFQSLLQEQGLDGALVCHPVDIFYFSGTAQNGYLWIPSEESPVLWVQRSLERARPESPLREIHPYPGLQVLGKRVAGKKGTRVGLEMDVLPTKEFLRLQERLVGAELEDGGRHSSSPPRKRRYRPGECLPHHESGHREDHRLSG